MIQKISKKISAWVTALLLLVPVLGVSGCAEAKPEEKPDDSTPAFRVVGYLYTEGNFAESFGQVDLNQITDLNLAFLNPDSEGNFPNNAFYTQLLKAAHDKGVRVFFSIGGGSPPAHLESLLATVEGRNKLVQGIVGLLDTYGFDGVDIDLENELINAHYAPFVSAVSQAVKPKGKLVTAALARWNSDKIGDATLAQYDLIHVMSYDATGPWNPDNAGPHSPFAMAEGDFKYYTETRKIPAEKVVVGVPFYGYGFNGAPTTMEYRDIVTISPNSEFEDQIAIGGGTVYYNGITTIRNKTRFAMENGAGGVMIWQLLQDTKDSKSLLNTINSTINERL